MPPLAVRNRASRNYKFWIYDSNLFNNALHPVTGLATPGIHTAIADITSQARDKLITVVMNKPGQVTFRLPLTSSAALQVVGYEVMRCLVVYNDDVNGNPVPRWSGPIWNVEMTTDNSAVNVTVVGWAELLNHRELRAPVYHSNIDAGVIATRLLSTANNQISNQNVVTATTSSSNNSQRTGINAGGTSAEDLLFGAGDFETNDSFINVNSATGSVGLSADWVSSGASSLKMSDPGGNSSISLKAVIAIPSNAVVVPASYTGQIVNSGPAVTVDPSSTYQIRGMVNTLSNPLGSSIVVTSLAADGSTAGAVQTLPIASNINGEFKTTFATYANTATVWFYVQMNRNATAGNLNTAYFDAFVVSKNAVGLVPTPIQLGSVASPANPAGANRTRSYQVGQKIGLAIEELSQIEAGFDYEVALVPSTVNGGATILRNMNVYYATVKGTINGMGTDRSNVFFGHRWGPNNVLSVRETHDSSRLANRVNARASGMLAMAQDPSSIALRNLMEDTIQISDAGVTSPTLLGYAGAELAYRLVPFKMYEVVPFPWDGDPSGKIPRFWIDYGLGDICYLVADNGAMKIGINSGAPQPVRIFGANIGIDMEGNEKISSLQTSNSS